MTTEIAVKEVDPVAISKEQLELIKRTIAADATPEELDLFLFDCKRQGVHPLDRLLHFSVRTNRRTGKRTYTPITSIDLMRIRAHDTGECAGIDDPVFDSDDDDRWATCTVWRFVKGHRCPFVATARWSEYDPGDGPDAFMWKKMPKGQLGKCAEALALRKAFPKQLHGVYERAEMMQADREERGGGEPPRTQRTTARSAVTAPSPAPTSGMDTVEAPTNPDAPELVAESRALFQVPQEVAYKLQLIERIATFPAAKVTLRRKQLGYETDHALDKFDVVALENILRHLEPQA